MKKILIFCVLILSETMLWGQATTVTATVVDSDGTTWVNGKASIQFVPSPSQPNINKYTFNGAALSSTTTSQGPISLGGSGSLSFVVYDSSQISPIGSQWQITVCPNASYKCSIFLTPLTGSSVNISSSLTAFISAPRFQAVSGSYGYNDTEAQVQLITGSTYFNVTSGVSKVWNGTSWIASNSAAVVANFLQSSTGNLLPANTNVITGCTLNSNYNTGGGTVATSCIQAQLDYLGTHNGGTLVVDGTALLDGSMLNTTNSVDGNIQTTCIQLHSNVFVEFPSGVFLQANSNCTVIGNNIQGNPAATLQVNMGWSGFINQNGTNQAKFEQNMTAAGNIWNYCSWFGGFDGVNISNAVCRNAVTFAFIYSNGRNLIGNNLLSTHDTTGIVNTDGFHFWGPLININLTNLADSNGDDDCVALNTDEGVGNHLVMPYQPNRAPWSGGDISNVSINGAQCNQTLGSMTRLLGVVAAGGTATLGTLGPITLSNFTSTTMNITDTTSPTINQSGLTAGGTINFYNYNQNGGLIASTSPPGVSAPMTLVQSTAVTNLQASLQFIGVNTFSAASWGMNRDIASGVQPISADYSFQWQWTPSATQSSANLTLQCYAPGGGACTNNSTSPPFSITAQGVPAFYNQTTTSQGINFLCPNCGTGTFQQIYLGSKLGVGEHAGGWFFYDTSATASKHEWNFQGNAVVMDFFANGHLAINSSTDCGSIVCAASIGGTPVIAAPGAIGGTTPNTGAFTTLTGTTFNTTTNCSSSASPAVCAAAAAGSVVVAAAATTVVVNTTAVTANSQIMVQEDSSLGTKLTVTCNTTAATAPPTVSARVAATSFTITTTAPTTNPRCFSYFIVN